MKNKEKRKYIFIFLVIVGITVFIGYTLSKFDRDIQERVYYKQVENMREISMQGSAVVEKQLGGLVNTLYGFAEYLREVQQRRFGNHLSTISRSVLWQFRF